MTQIIKDLVTWLRQWFYTKEEIDSIVEGNIVVTDTGWLLLTLNSSDVQQYSVDAKPRIRLKDGVVWISGAVKKQTSISNQTSYKVATLPEEYRPTYTHNFVQQGTGVNRFNLNIKTNGEIIVERYSDNDTTAQTIPNEHWLNLNCSYHI